MNENDTIVDWAEWGAHIPLRCSKCGMTGWRTKNIFYIGARSIFWFGDGPECPCPAGSLEPDADAVTRRTV